MARSKIPRDPVFDHSRKCYRVPLACGRTALVDAADLPKIAGLLWSVEHRVATQQPRVVAKPCRSRPETNRLSHLVLDAPTTERVIHRNDDPFDCRRSNLLRGGRAEMNQHQRKRRGTASQYKGVSWDSTRERWMAMIHLSHSSKRFLGRYADERRAAEAYDNAATRHFGEFARLNLQTDTITQETA